VPYAHVVFTVPEQLAPLALHNQRLFYNLLFRAASETLLEIAADPRHLGARIGALPVLHTWAQNLGHHPHLHCLIPAAPAYRSHARTSTHSEEDDVYTHANTRPCRDGLSFRPASPCLESAAHNRENCCRRGDTEDGRVVARLVVEREPRADLDELATRLGLRIHVARPAVTG
jgi:hypothetical protein